MKLAELFTVKLTAFIYTICFKINIEYKYNNILFTTKDETFLNYA